MQITSYVTVAYRIFYVFVSIKKEKRLGREKGKLEEKERF